MYDIKQFKPSLYLVLVLGLTGFSLAAESLGLWVLSMSGLALNGWLVFSGRFSPLPRIVSNIATLLALGYVAMSISSSGAPPLLFIGQFLLLLQLIKLFEQRSNRDYAQLLILSLLLMVAASISSTSLVFAVLMLVYLVVSLHCCLLFHLKAEADRAKLALAIPEDKISPAALRHDQSYLPSSMRRLTSLTFLASGAAAVLVFLFFPRGAGQGVLGQLQFKPSSALTGFSEKVSFDQINRIKQNDEIVARVVVWKNDKPVQGTESLFLRGLALDTYGADPDSRGNNRKPQWTRLRNRSEDFKIPENASLTGELYPRGDVWRQRILLRPSGSRVLFALPGLMFFYDEQGRVPAFRPNREITIRYCSSDGSIQSDAMAVPLEYEVYSSNTQADPVGNLVRQTLLSPSYSDPDVLAKVRAYTLDPAVAGELVAARSPLFPVQADNEIIARHIEHHLQAKFQYTLDLTDSAKMFGGGIDPIVAFLTRVRKGHCEYFASAMTLMCQSVGIPARMVVGFRSDEYNAVGGGYYIVREAHAHTWVEVLTQRGWVTFDPTSGNLAGITQNATLWQSLKHFFDFLEYTWGEKVVAYDARDQEGTLRKLNEISLNGIIKAMGWLAALRKMRPSTAFLRSSVIDFLAVFIGLMALAIVAAICWYIVQRYRLSRRAARIGLDALPSGQRLYLARQLAFYDQVTRVLEHHQIVRPPHLTPLEFCDSLVFLPTSAYLTIRRLTDILYRVRFGQTALNSARQRRLTVVVNRLAQSLETHYGPNSRAKS